MQKQPQQFKIEGYDLINNEIIVDIEKYSISIPVTIPLDKFEWWLKTNDRLQWEMNLSDHQGVHQQFTGTMSLEEYWNTDTSQIKEDLYGYISTNPITREGVVYSNSLQSLLLAFDLHNFGRFTPVFQERWDSEQDFVSLIN